MLRYSFVLVVIGVVAFLFSQRYQAQREQKLEVQRLERLDAEVRVKAAPSDLNDYCDTICKLHQCQGGQKDVNQPDRCLCFDQHQDQCELA